ncbi:MAG TPA: PEP/pyruvate-binding domain-containing protein, partial [Anaerolineae bacterium]|nr:PEP/pyruvate-binding domain-containing protein [Anaerolineae bacterium]
MSQPLTEPPNILAIYLQIAQYPILAKDIHGRMRAELFTRGIINSDRLEEEVKAKAILSQQREGISDPLNDEAEQTWEQRRQLIRDYLTDFYFAYNLPLDVFTNIVNELLAQRMGHPATGDLPFNPELAPIDLLLTKAQQYESMPEEYQAKVRHHLEEIIVVLIKTMISDQLAFVRVAKQWFTAEDFRSIRSRLIGSGKIGGKAAGMLLAHKILQHAAPSIAERTTVPDSYFIGADVFYDFLSLNKLQYNQKYKIADQIQAEYPHIRDAYEAGRFPDEIAEQLRGILTKVGQTPLIVRSSSLLEDNFGTSFAGKYESFFCANQGTPKENLRALTTAIRRIYASVYSPDALFYRRHMGLLDYDERMAILLQTVEGQSYQHYRFPTLAGVAFSRSPIVWSPRLRREDGFVRLVLGLGTRAVNRVADDYPRLITLSHPLLRPETTLLAISRYSQHFIDMIDVQANAFVTRSVRETIGRDYPALRWIASVNEDDTLLPIMSLGLSVSPDRLIITFDNLLQRTDFTSTLKEMLATLAKHYNFPVEMEFAASITGSDVSH